MPPVGLILVMALITVFGGVIVWRLGTEIQAWKWPTVEGRVVDAWVKECHDVDEYSDVTSYAVMLNYRYVIDEKEYSGKSQVAFFFTLDEAEKHVTSIPLGSLVEVFYHSKNPKNSMLEANENIGFNVAILVFVSFLFLSFLAFLLFLLFDAL